MEREEKTITLTKKDFFCKSMDAIVKDKKLNSNPLGTLMGAAIVSVITNALFVEEEKSNENPGEEVKEEGGEKVKDVA